METKTYYIVFEEQGYEQLIVRVQTNEGEDKAYEIANETFLSDRIDRHIVEPENLGGYDCAIVDEEGYQLDYSECMEKEER